ncbi:hypothetical protein MCUN1_003109 [Malassezia cuniculi]|uniref:SRP9 domain-containing protein n=1 Tax=Malassezia cuniculi TaxID=948313 RepID=A0AAF0ESY8_9BASI|nr:hypothetical protein MCUN1_003109 [Malassezia cuniculi]
MVFIADWGEFREQALTLAKPPARARLVLKVHPSKKRIDIKLATGTTSIKFRSHSTIVLNRLDALQRELIAVMSATDISEHTQSAASAGADAAAAVQTQTKTQKQTQTQTQTQAQAQAQPQKQSQSQTPAQTQPQKQTQASGPSKSKKKKGKK